MLSEVLPQIRGLKLQATAPDILNHSRIDEAGAVHAHIVRGYAETLSDITRPRNAVVD